MLLLAAPDLQAGDIGESLGDCLSFANRARILGPFTGPRVRLVRKLDARFTRDFAEALRLLPILNSSTRSAVLCGLLVLRHLAGFGRLRDPELNALLLPHLLILWARGWDLSWMAIPRSENVLADSLASRAVFGVHPALA